MDLVSFRCPNQRSGWSSCRRCLRLARSAIAAEKELDNFGVLYLQSIGSAPFAKRDFWEAYEQVIPSKRHQSVGKETGKTNYIERFNCTLRQRISRLVRKTLSFSKKIENHVGAIWYFVHHYMRSGIL
jgi:hypothetical protein